jgi:CO/xanthine dehydrogenase Mo-binding subunit
MKRLSLKVVGTAVPRLDGKEKVTGTAIYTSDIALPGMVMGKVLRSPLPHARIGKIDTQRAKRLSGVVAVLTGKDLTGFKPYGASYKDQAIIASDKVRYVGDPVAAVAAVDEATAAEALSLIAVEYEQIPAVTSLDQALASDAPLVHEAPFGAGEIHGYHYRPGTRFKGTNICYHFSYRRGDIDKGFRKAAQIFEDTFAFPRVHHYAMEPHVTIADFDGRRMTLWASSQDPFTLRAHLADVFSLPLNQVRIIVPYVGAGYGGKLSVKNEPLAAALSWKARRPVRLAYAADESFKTVTRHAARFRIRTGLDRNGRIIARECEIYMDTGAYADAGPRVTQKAGYRAPGPYRIPNLSTNAYTVYTNTVPAGAFRGFGTLQVTWAYESQMDIIAARLGFDPLKFRLKNLLRRGESFTRGDTPVDCDLGAGLRRVAHMVAGNRPRAALKPGIGLSCCMKDGGGTYKIASATVKMTADGGIILSMGTVEIGQGARTALSQILAEELAVPTARVKVAGLDTDTTPYDISTNASSSTVVMGLSILRAARSLKRQLLKGAARILKYQPSRLTLRNGRVYSPAGGSVPYEEIVTRCFGVRGGEIRGEGSYQDRKSRRALLGSPTTFWEVSWGGAETQIDSDTGEVRLQKYVSLADVGRAIHPQLCRGQDEGAVVMALGHTLLEEMTYHDGQPVNASLTGYRIPRFRDLPDDFRSILVESRNGPGPYGAKGMGEGGLLPVASAIANGLAGATGVRLHDLPLTPEKVWRALKARDVRQR